MYPKHHRRHSSATSDFSALDGASSTRVDSADDRSFVKSNSFADPSATSQTDGSPSTKVAKDGEREEGDERAGFFASIPLVGRLFRKRGKGKGKGKDKDEDEDEENKPEAIHIPDPPPEDMGAFELPPSKLVSLVDPKDISLLKELGGTDGLVKLLHSDVRRGLSDNEDNPDPNASVEDRKRAYGENRVPARKPKSLIYLVWLALQDQVLILLSIAAVVSLALGLYQDLGTPSEQVDCPAGKTGPCYAPKVDWVEGVAIIVAIMIVVGVGSANDYQKERQFRALNAQREQRSVHAIRGGKERLLDVHEIVVGDVLVLEPGEILPVDGVLLEGHNVKCDESSATGESDAISKRPLEDLERTSAKGDPFLLSGSKVAEGQGLYVTIAVGKRSFNGKIMMGKCPFSTWIYAF
jgi:Ca2+-transporting ATPase